MISEVGHLAVLLSPLAHNCLLVRADCLLIINATQTPSHLSFISPLCAREYEYVKTHFIVPF